MHNTAILGGAWPYLNTSRWDTCPHTFPCGSAATVSNNLFSFPFPSPTSG